MLLGVSRPWGEDADEVVAIVVDGEKSKFRLRRARCAFATICTNQMGLSWVLDQANVADACETA